MSISSSLIIVGCSKCNNLIGRVEVYDKFGNNNKLF